jgi:hypothetical protein
MLLMLTGDLFFQDMSIAAEANQHKFAFPCETPLMPEWDTKTGVARAAIGNMAQVAKMPEEQRKLLRA